MPQYYFLNYFPKCSFTSFTTVPESKNSAIKFGMAISPLNVSEIPQIKPRSAVAPTIAINAYAIINGLIIYSPQMNSIHLAPYNPHPRIVENAKQQSSTAVKIDTQLPYVATKPLIVSSAPASTP